MNDLYSFKHTVVAPSCMSGWHTKCLINWGIRGASGFSKMYQFYRNAQWQFLLSACLSMVAILPQALANSCTSDASCSFCGGYCETPQLVCMCPASFCSSIGGSCSFYGRYEDYRCQCPGGHFCGYWTSGNGCVSSTSTPTPAPTPAPTVSTGLRVLLQRRRRLMRFMATLCVGSRAFSTFLHT